LVFLVLFLTAPACTVVSMYDFDGDGVLDSSDCNPVDPEIYVGAPELCDDGIDNDCDSWVDCADGDCLTLEICAGDDDTAGDDDDTGGDDDTGDDDDTSDDDDTGDDDTSGDDDSGDDDTGDDDTSGDDDSGDDDTSGDDDSGSVADLSVGLVMYQPFCGSATDATGHGHDGTVSGATLTDDSAGTPFGAYHFDGADHLTVADDPDLEGMAELTVCTTLKPACDPNAEGCVVVSKDYQGDGSDSTDSFSLGIMPATLVPLWSTFNLQGNAHVPGPTPLVAGQWTTLCGSYDAGGIYLWVDGVLVAQGPAFGLVRENSSPVKIGMCGGDSRCDDRTFVGDLDEVAIWDRSLDASEIAGVGAGLLGGCEVALLDTGTLARDGTSPSDQDDATSTGWSYDASPWGSNYARYDAASAAEGSLGLQLHGHGTNISSSLTVPLGEGSTALAYTRAVGSDGGVPTTNYISRLSLHSAGSGGELIMVGTSTAGYEFQVDVVDAAGSTNVSIPGCDANNLNWWLYSITLLAGQALVTVDDGTNTCSVSVAYQPSAPLTEYRVIVDRAGGGSQWATADFDELVVLSPG
jgi:hypothetical protein